MGDRAVLLRFNEVALKGGNRSWFEDRVVINAKRLIQQARGGKSVPQPHVAREASRVVVYEDLDDTVQAGLDRLFGISGYSPMRKIPTEIETIRAAAVEEFENAVKKHGMPRTFRVETRRSEKEALPQSSMDIDRDIGTTIKDKYPELTVALKDAELTVGIEIRVKGSFIWSEKYRGLGGLPVGTNGKVLTLISGGIDSPVAAVQALKRGCASSYMHFYGTPFVGEEVLQKVIDIVKAVNQYNPDPEPLIVVPFGKIQEKVALATDPKTRTILYRRLMFRIACEFASRHKIAAIVTGESIGQVASQTIENLSTINSVATLPILRPLITYDKEDIIREAKRWGTFEASIRPGEDCCTLFADRHPALYATQEQLEEQEAKLPIQELIQEALDQIEFKKAR